MKVYLFVLILLYACMTTKQKISKIAPPGTVQLNDTLFVDKTEVPNLSWREYLLSFEKINDSVGLAGALPDTSVWWTEVKDDSSGLSFLTSNGMSEHYFRHPGFNSYPLVGITYEQAVDFCKWRTYAANVIIYWRENKIEPKYDSVYNIPIKFYYRLPTKQEWEMIAVGSFDVEQHPYGYKDVYTQKWKHSWSNFNCRYPNTKPLEGRTFYTADVKSYFPNNRGCFNMIGNVAEMVSVKGIAKGGSWMNLLDSCKIKIDQLYTKPEKWLGFRCVAVVLKEPFYYLDNQRQ